MSILRIISIVLFLIWAIIPFRQFKCKYFYYFLIMALTEPMARILYEAFRFPIYNFYIFISILLVLSLFETDKIKKNFWWLAPLFIILFASSIITKEYLLFLVSLHIVISYILLKRTMVEIQDNYELNAFYFVFLIYEISIILKFFVQIIDIKTGWAFFYVTSAFQILIGFYFILYNEKNSPKLSLNYDEKVE